MKILCIGRNYRDHATELGNSVPTEPVVFCKPDSAILQPRLPFVIPSWSQDIHHEVEWVVRIGRVGKFIEPEFAWSYVDAMTVGIDFTARDLQAKLKSQGLPGKRRKDLTVPPCLEPGFQDPLNPVILPSVWRKMASKFKPAPRRISSFLWSNSSPM